MTIRVLVADDQAVVRDGITLLLSAADGIEVVGEAGDGRRASQLAAELRPDVALIDLRMPEMSGEQVTAEIASSQLGTRVLVLTTYADDEAVMPALRAGAAGYLTKDVTSEALLAAIRDVAAGRTVLDPAVQHRLVQLVVAQPAPSLSLSGPSPGPEVTSEAGGLTRREVDVVRLVARGLNNRQVAREMYVSEATVKTHLNHILAKLGMEDRAALIAWAWSRGLVEPTGRADPTG